MAGGVGMTRQHETQSAKTPRGLRDQTLSTVSGGKDSEPNPGNGMVKFSTPLQHGWFFTLQGFLPAGIFKL